MHSIVLRLKSLFAIPFSLTIVLAIIEILCIFAFNRAFFCFNAKQEKYRTSLVSKSLPVKKYILINCLFSVCRINGDAYRNGRLYPYGFRPAIPTF